MDTLTILVFILVYLYFATRDFLGHGRLLSLIVTLAFFPYVALTVPIFSQLQWLGSSAAYAPVALLIGIYAALLWSLAPATARGMLIGAILLSFSIGFRALDLPLCEALPIGTHFLWHIMNAVMLAWMIEVYHRHMLAGRTSAG